MTTEQRIDEKFKILLREGDTILAQCGWTGSEYKISFPDDIDYRRFRTESLNLVRRVCGENSDHYQELKSIANGKTSAESSYYFKDCVGVLQAAQKDYAGSYLFDLRSLVAAELIGDFIEQAETLVNEGYYVPAASLAGAVLEDTLRKMCDKQDIPVPERTKLDKLNADLARVEAYSKLIQKRITALADIRNNADHGHFKNFTKEDVVDMVAWTKRFTADYLE